MLLNPEHVPTLDQIPESCQKFAEDKEASFVEHDVITAYANYTFDEALRKLLPESVEVPGSFETIGHVAHLNLRPPQEPYRLLIAQVCCNLSRKDIAVRTRASAISRMPVHDSTINANVHTFAHTNSIQQVMVDKYAAIKTVVHKMGSITNEFRVFSMEVLADTTTGGRVPVSMSD